MGLFSWVSSTARKSTAAADIQTYFEVSKKLGFFPGDPMQTANKIVELACTRVPELPSGRYKGYVLAAAALAIVLMEEEQPYETLDYFAMALHGMHKAAETERHQHSYEEQLMLEKTRQVLNEFREIMPSPMMIVHPKTSALLSQKPVSVPSETSQDRRRAMDELIARMKSP